MGARTDEMRTQGVGRAVVGAGVGVKLEAVVSTGASGLGAGLGMELAVAAPRRRVAGSTAGGIVRLGLGVRGSACCGLSREAGANAVG